MAIIVLNSNVTAYR